MKEKLRSYGLHSSAMRVFQRKYGGEHDEDKLVPRLDATICLQMDGIEPEHHKRSIPLRKPEESREHDADNLEFPAFHFVYTLIHLSVVVEMQ